MCSTPSWVLLPHSSLLTLVPTVPILLPSLCLDAEALKDGTALPAKSGPRILQALLCPRSWSGPTWTRTASGGRLCEPQVPRPWESPALPGGAAGRCAAAQETPSALPRGLRVSAWQNGEGQDPTSEQGSQGWEGGSRQVIQFLCAYFLSLHMWIKITHQSWVGRRVAGTNPLSTQKPPESLS